MAKEQIQEETRTEILNHYLAFSAFTYPGRYKDILVNKLPDDIREMGEHIRAQIIPKVVFQGGNRGYNYDQRYGEMTRVPWYRQPEDDYFPTAVAMIAELFRRDKRGIYIDRPVENRLILSCRFIAILTAAVLKSKDIPARVRSGFAPYFRLNLGRSTGHWLTQYLNKEEQRWVTIDIDVILEDLIFDPFDIPSEHFDFAADAWLSVREGKVGEDHFINAAGYGGLVAIVEAVFFDFHCLMNNEIIYTHFPEYMYNRFRTATKEELCEIDELAKLLQNPDKNFQKLLNIWNTKRKFRILKGGLI